MYNFPMRVRNPSKFLRKIYRKREIMMANKVYGYVRVSTRDQEDEHRQLIELQAFGVDRKNIYMDKMSGKDFNRPSYQRLVHRRLKSGDLLVVKSIDRLGRNYEEILNEWKYISKRLGADIKILDMPLLDTRRSNDLIGTLISDIVLQLLSFVAQNERENIRQRQAEGIAAAKARGVRFGRPPAVIPEDFSEIYELWRAKEITPQEARELSGLKYHTFYKTCRKLTAEYEARLAQPPVPEH